MDLLLRDAWIAEGWIELDAAGGILFVKKPSQWMSEAEWDLLKLLLINGDDDFMRMCKATGYKPRTILNLASLDSDGFPLRDL